MADPIPLSLHPRKIGRIPFREKGADTLLTENITRQFLHEMHAFLFAKATTTRFRMKSSQFTRKSILDFPHLATLLLYQHSQSLSARLQGFFTDGGFETFSAPATASAFCQARLKINPLFFNAWLNYAARMFYQLYEKKNLVHRWKGRLLYGIDGTRFSVPDTIELRGCCSIQTGPHYPDGIVQAHCSLMHDVLNKISINLCSKRNKVREGFCVRRTSRLLSARCHYANGSMV